MWRPKKRRTRTTRRRRKKKRYSGYFRNYRCDSSWELAYILYNLDHGISIKRNKKGFSYVYYKKGHKFYPDFIVNGEFVEVKGIMNRKNQAKIDQFPHPITVIGKAEIGVYLDYAKAKYGDDFPKLLKPAPKRVSKKTVVCQNFLGDIFSP